jgi:hypothetical protein
VALCLLGVAVVLGVLLLEHRMRHTHQPTPVGEPR